MKLRKSVFLSLLIASTVAIACTVKAMPPILINLSWVDVATTAMQGYANPLQAAMLKNLDKAGESLFGATAWKANGYKGNITYSSPNLGGMQGRHIHYVEKLCNEKAIDSAAKASGTSSTSGSAGGSAGFSRLMIASGCYGCDDLYGTVGDVEPLPDKQTQ